MLTFNNKEYRNLQEQVFQNQNDIEALKTKAEMADLGIKIISAEPYPDEESLPLPYGGNYGDGFLVGSLMPYSLYI